ncbi:MAG: 1-(5-phosphoribosyl)-5-[(5-phosphoribosylamino)methylideneamino]imidazole-4-carboxamide isomerase [Ruminococcaceae bacterium]|nr:1-(5-phosphoribosyl)-5-[(5-phosphoribosylamino)methylideneamino]imidazole-4-carboxamide isomerase [Oscillospiraceae bacterium]
MLIFPAVDLFEGKAVRLFKGDYNRMTVYSENPPEIALDFKSSGAEWIHLVDLEGAKSGETPNLNTIYAIKAATGLKCEVGGGIRSLEVIEKYVSAGLDRVILGTAAVTDEEFLKAAADKYGDKIAVGVDIKDGFAAIRGWTEKSALTADDMCRKMQNFGIGTLICTDISKDGAMVGTNVELYRELSEKYSLDIIASGGVSSIEDVKRLRALDLYGAIVGKAYYTGAINLKEAIEVAK